MKWKRNIASYPLWVLYFAIVSTGLYFGFTEIVNKLDLPWFFAIGFAVLCLIFEGTICLVLYSIFKDKDVYDTLTENKLIPGLVALVAVIYGVVVRVLMLDSVLNSMQNSDMFRNAQVVSGVSLPRLAQPASDLYLRFLHGVLFFFGNQVRAAAYMQIILSVVAIILIYFGVCKWSSPLAAAVTCICFAAGNYFVKQNGVLSPTGLYFVLFALGFCLLVYGNSTKYIKISGALSGIIIGALTYFHPAGLFLAFVYGAVRFRRHDAENRQKWFGTGLCALTTLLSLFGCFLGDSLSSSCKLQNVFRVYLQQFSFGKFTIPELFTICSGTELLIASGLMAIGVFAFWKNRRSDITKSISCLLILAVLICAFSLLNTGIPNTFWMAAFCAFCAGSSVQSLIFQELLPAEEPVEKKPKEKKPKEKKIKEKPAKKEKTKKNKGDKISSETAQISEETLQKQGQTVAVPAEPGKYLDNPLPVPKKHVKKTIDFDVDVDDDDYDYAVSDDDDYDIP